MTVKVCDVIMGAGKTESAITRMKEDKEARYVFITPYLDEVERIKTSCAERSFVDPKNRGCGKLEDLHDLLREKCNIASTHALFKRYTDETLYLIEQGGYKLILDEVVEVVEHIPISNNDLDMLLNKEIIGVEEDGRVRWLDLDYVGRFEDLRDMCMTGHVVMFDGGFVLWTFPVEVFRAFRETTVLTYMFDAQIQKYYFDMCGIEFSKIGTVFDGQSYRFSDTQNMPEYVKALKDKIHILDNEKLNRIGDRQSSLSSSWFDRANKKAGKPEILRVKKNLANVMRNVYGAHSEETLWTTFKKYKDALKGRGYTGGFLSFNVRATNAYRDRTCLAYCVNVYYNPFLKNYFLSHGVEVKEDQYALSEMIQWVWRSAIRDGKEINIYIPSKRMRTLFQGWLDLLAQPGECESKDAVEAA